MGALFGWIGAALTTIFGGLLGGWKTFLTGIVLKVTLAFVLYNLVAEVFGEVLTWVADKLGAVTVASGSVTSIDMAGFSSLLGWLGATMKIPEQLSIMVTCILAKFMLRKIPFVRW
jgi:hypothetical protein